VYNQDKLLDNFLTDRIAHMDATIQYVLACLFAAEDFPSFREKVREGLSEVEVNVEGVTSDAALLAGRRGWVIKTTINERTDYLRDSDGKPVVYDALETAERALQLFADMTPELIKLSGAGGIIDG
jgi:hypothetical protein